MKVVKAAVLIAVAVKLLTLFDRDVHQWASDFVTRHGIDTAGRFVENALDKLAGIGNKQIVTFSVVAFAYSGLLLTEGVGLWMQKRWAEYLTVIATGIFIPLELYEIYERFTFVRLGILALNVFVVWYLVTRLRDERSEKSLDVQTALVKICGITNLEDALHSIESGADALGFNFYWQSPRYICPADAKAICKDLPRVSKVGIFVNASTQEIVDIVAEVGLDAVQLHGDETPEFIVTLRTGIPAGVKVIKALRVATEFDSSDAAGYPADAVLLDAYSRDGYGGSGETFDWKTAAEVRSIVGELYLAGGLTAENVADAIRTVKPDYVDAASLLESSPGRKDPDKVAAFIKAAKGAL